MVATHQEVNASPSVSQAVGQSLERKPLPTIFAGELEPVVADLVKKALSNPATWLGGLPTTPLCSFGPSTPPLDADELEKQLVDAAETRSQFDSTESNGPSPGITDPCEARFKKVLEVWDKDISKYKIVESIEPEVDNFGGYVFVVRGHIDPNSKKSTTYVDVKSETLRDLLREVLENVKAVSAMEPKPSIEQNVLFHFLPELKSKLDQSTHGEQLSGIHSATTDGIVPASLVVPSPADPKAYADCAAPGNLQHNARSRPEGVEHLRLLVDHIDKAYAATVERLTPLLQRGEITYDLLELLFKPGCRLYTKCLGTGKSRGVVFDVAEETTRKDVTHLKLECHYLDHGWRGGPSL
ncbi:hypothetical protein BDW71DRAFT_211951 [Aspergillus fruticulosus]